IHLHLLAKKTTLYLALYTLNSLLLPSVSTPRFDLCWFMKSEPFSLLHSLALLFDRRETNVISMKTVDILYALLKEFMRLLTEYVTSIQDDYNQDGKLLLRMRQKCVMSNNNVCTHLLEMHRSNSFVVQHFYKESLNFSE
ncbi:924_t:CDS:1, partial [Cetraspora pellucida]